MTSTGQRSRFAQKFERAYRDVRLPAIYRDFILSDAFIPYEKAVIRGLWTYGPTDVELRLSSPILLKRDEFFDRSGITAEDAAEYHPIATLPASPQFLAIDATSDAAPVFLWHHETGAFHLQFETFAVFLDKLRTPQQAREERARARQLFADIRKECKPALARAKKHFGAGNLDAAAAALDAGLRNRQPIPFDRRNDFAAISILCDCFNLRGRIFLAKGRLELARAAFFDATEGGGRAYGEAVVGAVVTSFLLHDVAAVFERVGTIRADDFPEPPSAIMNRNFTEQQLADVKAVATSGTLADAHRQFADEVVSWMSVA